MKNYLLLLKQILTKNNDIADSLGLEFAQYKLMTRVQNYGPKVNRFNINKDNMIFFYPVNDGTPTCPFKFYKGNALVIDNQCVFKEITNLDEIILQMVRVFDKALDEKIILNPYRFMLKLTGEVESDYMGDATLVITDKAIMNNSLKKEDLDGATKYFINRFLDHFIGWNFGVSVNRNETLKKELEALNQKVIDMKIRKYAGTGFEVYGTDNEAKNGLQHYTLPLTNNKKIKKINKRKSYK